MQQIRYWYAKKTPEGKSAVLFTAASVAVTGLGLYVFARLNGHSNHSVTNFKLADHTSDLSSSGNPDVSIGTPDGITENIGSDVTIGTPEETIGHIDIGTPEAIGTSIEHIGTGRNLSDAHASAELFTANSYVETWPDTVTVSRWNPYTKDGSLWGISSQILQRSGVAKPTTEQITRLVDTLRPQALPDGRLIHGQTLDLRPALSTISK